MTNEEAIKILKGAIKQPNTKDGYMGQALDMAIKALEAPPCEDAISRDAAIDIVQSYIHEIISESGRDLNAHTNRVLREVRDGIKDGLPSVMPEQKAGRWIPTKYFDELYCRSSKCSECGAEVLEARKYCSNCGSKMEVDG